MSSGLGHRAIFPNFVIFAPGSPSLCRFLICPPLRDICRAWTREISSGERSRQGTPAMEDSQQVKDSTRGRNGTPLWWQAIRARNWNRPYATSGGSGHASAIWKVCPRRLNGPVPHNVCEPGSRVRLVFPSLVPLRLGEMRIGLAPSWGWPLSIQLPEKQLESCNAFVNS